MRCFSLLHDAVFGKLFLHQHVEGEGDVAIEVEVGDLGGEAAALAEETGDDVVGAAREIADVEVVPVDAHGVFVVGVGWFGDEVKSIADLEVFELVPFDVVFRASELGGL